MPNPPHDAILAIGSYTETMPHVRGRGEGITLVRFDTHAGRFGDRTAVGGIRNPSYLAIAATGDRLHAVSELDAADRPTVETCALDPNNLALRPLASTPLDGGWPCHVALSQAADRLYISQYATGDWSILALDPAGIPRPPAQRIARAGNGPHPDRQDAAHAHCALPAPDGRHLWLCDLGTDAIARHPIVAGVVAADPDLVIAAEPGAGPRHIAFTPDGASMLALHELASTVTLHRLTDPARPVATLALLPDGVPAGGTAAALRIHPGGRFAYASNRGDDSIVALRLDPAAGTLAHAGRTALGGRTPRDIAVDPSGRFLLAASQDDHLIQVFAIDPATGALADTGTTLAAGSPVCLCFAPWTPHP